MLDTVHDTEKIKWELWRVAYGVWNHIKNSGQFPAKATSTPLGTSALFDENGAITSLGECYRDA
jgi:hypothetical protein